ncbi:hypothetical protein ACFV90_15185 [Streptomyces sp. NPDC059904]|uniref:hypothetical protein n=1 Tax=Streptomyces sp. NPDC059904 TaxID=3346996 RepID=UPI003646B09D
MDSSSLLDFRPEVTVDADAPFGKRATGRGTFNFRSPQGTSYSPKGTLNVNVPVPVMCLVVPKDAKLHDPVRIWKRSDIDKAEYASDWRYANNRLESTDGTSADGVKCAYNWPTQRDQVQMWLCQSDSRPCGLGPSGLPVRAQRHRQMHGCRRRPPERGHRHAAAVRHRRPQPAIHLVGQHPRGAITPP